MVCVTMDADVLAANNDTVVDVGPAFIEDVTPSEFAVDLLKFHHNATVV